MERIKIPLYFEELKKRGVSHFHLRISDGFTPEKHGPKMEELWKSSVICVSELLRDGKRVAVHCRGGRHRTACFVLSVMKCMGVIDKNSVVSKGVKWIRESRKGAKGNTLQHDFVKRLEF